MPRYLLRGCAFVVLCSSLLLMPVAFAARNGIEVWRDQQGTLNISNVPRIRHAHAAASHGTLIYTTTSPLSSDALSPSTIVPRHTGRVAARTRIYSYVDDQGTKCFTNVPTGSRRYELALQTDFSTISPLAGDLATRRSAYDSIVAEASQRYQVDQSLVRAVIHAESGFNPAAVSPKGATGLMQLMPDTAQRYGVRNIFDPNENIDGGVHYLRDLLDMFNNNLSLAVAAYNAGEHAVSRYGDIPPYAETSDYVRRVLALHADYRNMQSMQE